MSASIGSRWRPSGRIQVHVIVWSFLVASLLAPIAALAQENRVGVICSVEQVFRDGEDEDVSDMSLEDLLNVEITTVAQGTPPSGTGDLPNGGQGAFWDQQEQNRCALIKAGGELRSGFAAASRIVVEDSDVEDALASDSIGYQVDLGDFTLVQCGFRIADEDGQTLNTHLEWPQDIDPSKFTQRECFAVANPEAGGSELVGTSNSALTYRYSKEGAIIVEVPYGDVELLILAVRYINSQPFDKVPEIDFIGAPQPFIFVNEGLPTFVRPARFIKPGIFQRSIGAPTKFRFMRVGDGGSVTMNNRGETRIEGFESSEGGGAIWVEGTGRMIMRNIEFKDNRCDGNGGAMLISGDGSVDVAGMKFTNNSCAGNGGAVAVTDTASFSFLRSVASGNSAGQAGGAIWRGDKAFLDVWGGSTLRDNMAGTNGGAIALTGDQAVDSTVGNLPLNVKFSTFGGNKTGGTGCDLYVELSGANVAGPRVSVFGNAFTEPCEKPLISINKTQIRLLYNTVRVGDDGVELNPLGSSAEVELFGNIFEIRESSQQLRAAGRRPKPQAACEGDAGGTTSLGYNISSDQSCNLNQATDLPGTDPLLSGPDENGISTPLPGSPAIDIGPAGLVMLAEDDTPTLPCGWSDLTGLGRPQDGDGDGQFECDAGAVEVEGMGEIQAGHSGAFYNSLRNGEGQYVEILGGGRAVVYTFTYTPDGSGPAWFTGVANVVGNSLVIDDLRQPIGTGFGEAFDPEAIDFALWGAMSMVFPACANDEPPGNVAYSGDAGGAYEPLITRAERITDVASCDARTTPHPSAGLSGSWFDPERNGEGLIIEWLPDGRVLAIMFTFDPDGGQMWIFGIGQSDGQSVSIDAVYPTGFTSWGSGFDTAETMQAPWGTFVITWNDCNNLVFEYDSPIEGYGEATRNYQRITTLDALDCQAVQ